MIRLAVVADTHVPDRLPALPPAIFEILAGVDAILHAGDLCTRSVIDQLAAIAPVHAVAGNADWFLRLPPERLLAFGGLRIGLTHGHGGLLSYALDKLTYYTRGVLYFSRYARRVQAQFRTRQVQAIVFGHSHFPVNQVHDGVLIFNPGSVAPTYHAPASIGLLTIHNGAIHGQIVPLNLNG